MGMNTSTIPQAFDPSDYVDDVTTEVSATNKIKVKAQYEVYDSSGGTFLEGESGTVTRNTTSFVLVDTFTLQNLSTGGQTVKAGCQHYNTSGGVGTTTEIRHWDGSSETVIGSHTHGSASWVTVSGSTTMNNGDEIRIYTKASTTATISIRNRGVYGQYTETLVQDTVDYLA